MLARYSLQNNPLLILPEIWPILIPEQIVEQEIITQKPDKQEELKEPKG